MRVVILAAGMGTRLGKNHPKPLTSLADGRSILQTQVEAFTQYVTPDRLLLVLGHQKEQIIEAFPELNYVVNPDYAEQNTSKSLLCALQTSDEDCLWANGDVVFQPKILVDLLKLKHSWMAVNSAVVGEEEVKYRTDSNRWITEVSKNVEDAEGEALGINYVTHKDLPLLRKMLEKADAQDYFEKGVELALQEGMQVQAAAVPENSCIEVDFPEDLQKANQLVKSWARV